MHHERINDVFGAALGNLGFLVRSPDLEEIEQAVWTIQEKA